ncbi:transcriptional regulator [Bacillus sp. FJAT-27231]|uniref:LysR family transcriptional regulator n=1 Tax=Bacillus sp. FJAT-27231 TaxID=1679168 RepID=UPI000670F828|nr:LysR family transcriptional regulator [Bacillus sp. FJAT-27231]KMY55280.1 transcriptional regulator [Bacillus sp. FJAT-27231]
MEIRHLQYFITIVEKHTFTNAASALHISQPSLSASIKKLENELGLVLLDRSSREVQLTKEGKILYQEAKKLVNHFEHVENEMKRLKEQGPLELSIGVIESTKYWVPKILARFKGEYKHVRIHLMDILSLTDVEKALSNFNIHLAITNQYINSEEIEVIPIYEEKLVALLPENHPLRNNETLTIEELNQEPFIICKEGFQTRTDILNAFQKAGIKPNIQFEIERFETACRLVEEGLGATVLPENYVKYSETTHFHVKPLEDPNLSRIVYVAFDKNRYLPPLVLRFIALVKAFFEEEQMKE